MSYWVVAAAVLIVCAWAVAALAEEAAPSEKGETAVAAEQAAPTEKAETTPTVEAKVYDPATTKVAILPFVNATEEKWRDRQRACDRGTNKLRGAFGKRGFQVLGDKLVRGALSKLAVDLSRAEQRSLVTYEKVAGEVGADLVVCGALLRFEEESTWGIGGRKSGHATIEVSMFDAKASRYRLYTVLQGESQGAGSRSAVDDNIDAISRLLVKGTTFCEMAVEDGIVKAIKDFLKPYPEKKK
jgi:hypothetical protein